jgi:hypothetical protein
VSERATSARDRSQSNTRTRSIYHRCALPAISNSMSLLVLSRVRVCACASHAPVHRAICSYPDAAIDERRYDVKRQRTYANVIYALMDVSRVLTLDHTCSLRIAFTSTASASMRKALSASTSHVRIADSALGMPSSIRAASRRGRRRARDSSSAGAT